MSMVHGHISLIRAGQSDRIIRPQCKTRFTAALASAEKYFSSRLLSVCKEEEEEEDCKLILITYTGLYQEDIIIIMHTGLYNFTHCRHHKILCTLSSSGYKLLLFLLLF